MTTKRKHIIPRGHDYQADGDFLKPLSKRLWRFLASDETFPAYQKVKLTPRLFADILGHLRHLNLILRIQRELRSGRELDWQDLSEFAGFSNEACLAAYYELRRRTEEKGAVLDQSFIYGFCQVLSREELRSEAVACADTKAESGMSYWCRAVARLGAGRVEEARRDFLQANVKEPTQPEILHGLAQLYFVRRRDPGKALIWVNRALACSNPGRPHERVLIHALKGEISAALGKWAEVVSHLHSGTAILRHLVEDFEWDDHGESVLPSGARLYGEGIRALIQVCNKATQKILSQALPAACRRELERIACQQGKLLKLM